MKPTKRNIILLFIGASLAAASTPVARAAGLLSTIKDRGTLIVGVNTDYKPFGFVNTKGKIVGLEIDLARALAQRMHVKVSLVPVQPANRIQFLQQGRIDIIIASLSYTSQRAQVVGMIDPPYYSGGTALLARDSAHLSSWTDLRGKNVCGTEGALYNRPISVKYGANVVAFPTSTGAENALLNGNCVGYVEDSGFLSGVLGASPDKWKGYSISLPFLDQAPWVMAVAKNELQGKFAHLVSQTIANWHSDGELIRLSQKWHLPVTKFVNDMHQKYSAK
jgi:polar amino acid transport system substrate-binding protein